MLKISETDVYNMFVTRIRFIHNQWREIDIWPDKNICDLYAPTDFKAKFPSTRVVVDVFEKKPKAPAAQQVTFSSYKNRNTVKALVCTTLHVLVNFMPEAYGGSTSDREIVEWCL